METLTVWNLVQAGMWLISLGLVPAFTILFRRTRALELKMETRISHQDAAAMIRDSSSQMEKRFDKLEDLILESLRGK